MSALVSGGWGPWVVSGGMGVCDETGTGYPPGKGGINNNKYKTWYSYIP